MLTHYLDQLLDNALGNLVGLLQDDTIREVMVNGPDDIWVERQGHVEKIEAEFSAQASRTVIHTLLALSARTQPSSGASVLVDAAWRDWRFSAVLPPVAVRGIALCFRKHGSQVFPLATFLNPLLQEMPPSDPPQPDRSNALEGCLRQWMVDGQNLLITGGTGAGKTALLNALMALIPPTQRVLVMEDTRELQVHVPNHVVFEANPSCQVTLRDLVRQALRFRPDRLVVGEVRGAEAFDLIQAMNTGHRGCLGTLHANHAEDALHRLTQLILQAGMGWSEDAIARQIARTVHAVVHVERTSGQRHIHHVRQLEGYENGVYRWS